MLLFHGDNQIASRKALLSHIDSIRDQFSRVLFYPASELNLPELHSILGAVDLFNQQNISVIEELHSLPVSTKKSALISILSQNTAAKHVILWEKKVLTAKQLSTLGDIQAQFFKTSRIVYRWLEAIVPNTNLVSTLQLQKDAIQQDGAEHCFALLAIQVRQLLLAKTQGTVSGPSFAQAKIRSQAQKFSLQQLLDLHRQLLAIDVQQKNGKAPLPLKERLDQLIIEL